MMRRSLVVAVSLFYGTAPMRSGIQLVRNALGDHIFEKFIENKKIEWDGYRSHVYTNTNWNATSPCYDRSKGNRRLSLFLPIEPEKGRFCLSLKQPELASGCHSPKQLVALLPVARRKVEEKRYPLLLSRPALFA